MKLGQQVLNKIEDLILQIDRPKSRQRKKVRQPSKEVSFTEKYSNTRLHDNHKLIQTKRIEKQKQKMADELRPVQDFKVQNKHSIFLNNLNKQKPLYQRTNQIIQQRAIDIQRKRMRIDIEKEKKRILMGQEDNQIFSSRQVSRSKSQRRFATQEELDEIVSRLTLRQQVKKKKVHNEKLLYLKDKLLNSREKPELNQSTQKVWQKRKLERSLSSNVFQRLKRYQYEQKRHQDAYLRETADRQTPFRPTISKRSQDIIKKSGRKSLLRQDLSMTNLRNVKNQETPTSRSMKKSPSTANPTNFQHNQSHCVKNGKLDYRFNASSNIHTNSEYV